ncbi:TIGR03943 family putative permease subunit [Alkalibacillus haloalkaliphilus]|uniref:Permease n=1 Tax=Alkalibacillus haloalkaliphilus TaxID=94136 RepID=A0A511W336_9BACI|nr:TIGR03943 family protein [Alkalibacillus haloalkaliphilus]GEN45367.1 permease [Alkalibacillus haloalkaliphilus]
MSKTTHLFIRGVILLGFTMLLFNLIWTGDINRFIAPRMMPYFYFALVVMGVLGTIQLFRNDHDEDHDHHEACHCAHDHDYQGSKKKFAFIYALFIIPIFTGLLFSGHVLGSSQAQTMGFKHELRLATETGIYANNEESQQVAQQIEQDREESATGDENNDPSSSGPPEIDEDEVPEEYREHDEERYDGGDMEILTPESMYPELKDEMLATDHIVMTEDNYVGVISLLEENPDAYVGKELTIEGFTFREDDFNNDQLVVGRFGITCCTADAGIFGLLLEDSQLQEIRDDTWLRVTGTIETVEYNNWQLATLEDIGIERIEQPDDPYVYEQFDYSEL